MHDAAPGALAYATVHDVRPWSAHAAAAVLTALAGSPRLAAIHRRALGLPPQGPLDAPGAGAVEAAVARTLALVRGCLGGGGDGADARLSAAALVAARVFLFRNHAALALDLAAAGHLTPAAALRVCASAAPALRLAEPGARFGFDDGEAAALQVCARARVGTHSRVRSRARMSICISECARMSICMRECARARVGIHSRVVCVCARRAALQRLSRRLRLRTLSSPCPLGAIVF